MSQKTSFGHNRAKTSSNKNTEISNSLNYWKYIDTVSKFQKQHRQAVQHPL